MNESVGLILPLTYNVHRSLGFMRYIIHDRQYHFDSAFDTETGTYVRTGILNEQGQDTGDEPFMASFPHLIDVGVMGHCIHGKTGLCMKAGIGCYQSGLTIDEPNMSVADFRRIAEECRHRTNQFALGGRGDPDQHEHFEELLTICRENDIVPNFTTSGYGLTPETAMLCKQYCGAVAVSWYRNEYTLRAIDLLLQAGVRTNVHYVVGNNTVDEAIQRLQSNSFPKGINAVIFLLHKPAGLGAASNVLSYDDPRVRSFFSEFDRKHPYKIGMDSCNVPGALHFCHHIMHESLDTCEGGRFSCYIGPDMTMTPCSFDQHHEYDISLHGRTIEQAWNSLPFNLFRKQLRSACPHCAERAMCLGGCPLMPEIVFCNDICRTTMKEDAK